MIKALIEDKSVFLGLQKRMEDMASITFNSMRVAFATNLLTIDKEDFKIKSLTNVNPNFDVSKDYNDIILASKRLGDWFAKYNLNQIANYLNITF